MPETTDMSDPYQTGLRSGPCVGLWEFVQTTPASHFGPVQPDTPD